MLGPLVDDHGLGAELKDIDRAGRWVGLLEKAFAGPAISTVADHMRTCPYAVGCDVPFERTTAARKAQRGRHDQAAVFLLAAFGAALRVGVRLALAFMKSMTSGRMLSRQLRPAKIP